MTPEQIRQRLKEIAKGEGPAVSNIAKVVSVDEAQGTCKLEDEDGQFLFNVRLRPIVSNKKSFLLLPKVGSYVLAIRIEDDEDWMVIAADEIDKIGYYVGNSIVEITQKIKIEANNENLGQLIDALFTALQNMVFVTPAGNTTSMVNIAEFVTLKERFKSLLH